MTSEKTSGWMEGLSRGLVHHAARRAPGELAERLAEEWLADLSERPQGLSRLRFGLGCCWATSIIARERRFAPVPAAAAASSPAAATASLGGFVQLTPAFTSRRTATFVLVASLHALALAMLMLGLTVQHHPGPPPDIQTKIIDEPRPPVDAPTIDKPNITSTVIEAPRPDRDLPFEPDPVIPTAVAPTSTTIGPSEPTSTATHVVSRVQGHPGAGFPNTNDFYPPVEIRAEAQGVTAVSACVDSSGRLTSDPSILDSSGNARLDQAALRLARAGSGHYAASTEDGRPVPSCFGFRVRFTLKR